MGLLVSWINIVGFTKWTCLGGGGKTGDYSSPPGSVLTLIRVKNGRLLGLKRLSIVPIKVNTKYPNTGH